MGMLVCVLNTELNFLKNHTITLIFLVILFKCNSFQCHHSAQLREAPFSGSGSDPSPIFPSPRAGPGYPVLQGWDQPTEVVIPEILQSYVASLFL